MRVAILDLAMQLAGYMPGMVGDLKDNLCSRIGKRHGAEVLGLLRSENSRQTKLAPFAENLFDGRSRTERQLVGFVEDDKTAKGAWTQHFEVSNEAPNKKLRYGSFH